MSSDLSGRIISDGVLVLALRLLGGALSLGVQWSILYWVGVSDFGIYAAMIATAEVLASVLVFGLDLTGTRVIGALGDSAPSLEALRFVHFAVRKFLARFIALSVVCFVGASLPVEISLEETSVVLLLTFAFVPMKILVGILRGSGKLREAVSLMQFSRPVAVFVAMLVSIAGGEAFTGQQAAVAGAIGVFLGVLLASGAVPWVWGAATAIGQDPTARQGSVRWTAIASSLGWAGVLTQLRTRADLLLVSVFLGTDQAGQYAFCRTLVSSATLPLGALNFGLARRLSKSWSDGAITEAKAMMRHTSLLSAGIGFPALVTLSVFGGCVLESMDSGVVEANSLLPIFSIGQFFSIVAGPVVLFHAMAGYEKILLRVAFVGAIGLIAIGVTLVPDLGSLGAAVAASLMMTISNVWLAVSARKLCLRAEMAPVDEPVG